MVVRTFAWLLERLSVGSSAKPAEDDAPVGSSSRPAPRTCSTEMRNAKRLHASDLRPKAVNVVLLIAAIFFLTLALMQLAKGLIPDSPSMPGPTNSSVF